LPDRSATGEAGRPDAGWNPIGPRILTPAYRKDSIDGENAERFVHVR
jgi:hypothetical protein